MMMSDSDRRGGGPGEDPSESERPGFESLRLARAGPARAAGSVCTLKWPGTGMARASQACQ